MKKCFFVLVIYVSLFLNVFAQVDYGKLNIEIVSNGLIIGTPGNLDLGTVTAGSTVETGFSDYFWIEDLRGTNTGHYTTIQCDGLYGPDGATSTVITGVELSGASVEMIAGRPNDTLIYSNLNTWTDITEPQLYLYRNDNVSNNGVINKYGNKPAIRVTFPAGTPSGTYKGRITYTLYDMPFSY